MSLKPWEFQIRAKEFWLQNKQVYFAIDMGMGKTIISLMGIDEKNLPTLVVSPLGPAYSTWPDEIKKWNFDSGFDYKVLHGAQKQISFNSKNRGVPLHIANYDGLKWLYIELFKLYKSGKPFPYKALILDEGTAIKDPKSDRFGYLCAIRDMFSHIAILSGTPSPNSLEDLWAQYFILDKGEALGTNFRTFKSRHFSRDPYRKYTYHLKFGSDDFIYRRVAPRTFRLKSSDYINLTKRKNNPIYLELPSREREQYNQFKRDFILALEKVEVKTTNKTTLSTKLRQFLQGAIYENLDDGGRRTHYLHDIKVNALKQILEFNVGKSFLCLVQYKFEFEMLRKAFPQASIIQTGVPQSERDRIIKAWNAKQVPLLIAHPKSVGSGMNLQEGGFNLIWFALTYSLFDFMQANKRLHRPGQNETVVIHYLLFKDTMDELVLEALNIKDGRQSDFLHYLRKETMKRWKSLT